MVAGDRMPEMMRASVGRIVPAVPVRVGGRAGGRGAAASSQRDAAQSKHEREGERRPPRRRTDSSDDSDHAALTKRQSLAHMKETARRGLVSRAIIERGRVDARSLLGAWCDLRHHLIPCGCLRPIRSGLLIVHSRGENHEAHQTNRWGSYWGIAL